MKKTGYTILLTMLMSMVGVKTYAQLVIDGLGYYFSEDREDEVYVAKRSLEGYIYEGDIIIPESITYDGKTYKVTSIGKSAFSYSSITSVTIPSSVYLISNGAFFDSKQLTSVTILSETLTILKGAFHGCPISDITIMCPTPPYVDVSNSIDKNAIVYVPYGCRAAYKADDMWRRYEIKEIPAPEFVSVNLTDIATFSSEYRLDFSEIPQIKAYIASGFSPSTGELTLTRVYKVPAREGLLLKGETGEYEVPTTETDMYYSNLLKGMPTATTISPTDGDYTNFILANGANYGIGFYPLSQEGEIAAGKAYLQLPTSVLPAAGARGIKLVFDDEENVDETTGIESLTHDPSQIGEKSIYTLSGQRVEKTIKGNLYIVNGKKLLAQ